MAAAGGLSLFLFLGTLALLPILILRIPADYFASEKGERKPWQGKHPLIRSLLLIIKNILGVILIAAGILMLFIPGQGLLTIFLGLVMLNFPGKYRLENRLIRIPRIYRGINWIRMKRGREPLIL